jgi:nicotinate-nucleotide--dimethylbenzimidazole phosphoribosyltransferase
MPVAPPEAVGRADRALGRIGAALERLAATQGSWPPRAPTSVRRLVLSGDEGSRETGIALADEIVDSGGDLVVLSCDADQVAGIVVAAALLALEPVHAVGTVSGADWAALTVGVRTGLRATRTHVGDPVDLLVAAGSPVLSTAAGLLAQCARRRTPVLLDGSPLVCGAALVAERLAPGASAWWIAGQVPPNPAAARALVDLDLVGLLDLQLALPLGGDLALSVLLQALRSEGLHPAPAGLRAPGA